MSGRKKVAVVALAILLLSAFGLALWGRDEPLGTEAGRLLQSSDIAAADNVYYSLLGFTAPANGNPTELASQLIQRQVQATSSPDPGAADALKQAGTLHFSENILSVCGKGRTGEIACLLQNRVQIEKVLEQNKALLDRYIGLLDYGHFSDPASGVAVPLPLPFVDLQRAKMALWAKSILLINDGRAAQGLDILQRDNRFWRMLFVQADTLLMRMVAIAMLRRQCELLSQTIAYFPSMAALEKDKLLRISVLFSASELSFRHALAGELRFFAGALAQLNNPQPESAVGCSNKPARDCVQTSSPNWSLEHPFWRTTPLYRHNATMNLHAALLERWIEFSELPAQQIIKQREPFVQALKNTYASVQLSSSVLYNRIGRQLVAAGFADISGYLLQAYDLDGLGRLINLQIQIAALRLPDERVGPFLQTSAAALTNPYTGEAMLWDAKDRTLSFMAQGEGSEMSVMLGKSVMQTNRQ